MKKLIFSLTAAALMVTAAAAPSLVAQQPQTAGQAKAVPHQVGLIDMAHVFKEYEKFKALREDLQQEIKATDSEAKAKIEDLKRIQEQLQSGQFVEGSPDYQKLEAQGLKLQTELEAFRKVKQRDFLRKESEIYKTVYMEVQQAVEKYAYHYDYTLIVRFNRNKVDEAENPQAVLQSMNRQVVYHRPQDDITEPVLAFLNRTYRDAAGSASK